MFRWLFTDEFREKLKARKKLASDTSGRVRESLKDSLNSNYTHETTTINGGTNVINAVQRNGIIYKRIVKNGVETITINGKVLTGEDANEAKKQYEDWKEDFSDSMKEFREDMDDFKQEMSDMAKDLKNMFK